MAPDGISFHHASIIADGTIDGADFTFTTAVSAEQNFEGNLVLSAGSNLTLNSIPAPVTSRRRDATEANRSQIENNIQSSSSLQDDTRRVED